MSFVVLRIIQFMTDDLASELVSRKGEITTVEREGNEFVDE